MFREQEQVILTFEHQSKEHEEFYNIFYSSNPASTN